ncbi:MAG TPA: regulatory protein RecX [Clostridia bacterium]|nr:regulatory protein RecX [Clostridia bacterium]
MAGRRREHPAAARERRAAVDDPGAVLEAAARFLEVRPRSVAEVRRRLNRAGYRPELVQAAIERLLELGMLDDRAFAETWIASRDRARPRGERALRQELAQKGIERELIDELLAMRRTDDEGLTIEPDLDAARRLLERNGRALERVVDPRQRRARAYALLARNGFDPDVCRAVAAGVVGSDDTGDGPGIR